MKFYDIAQLYRVRLKERSVLTQEILALLGLSVGVALLFASQIASTSLDGSVQKLTRGIVGQSAYQLKARSAQGFNERVLSEVQRLPGVRSAIPVLEQNIGLVGPTATLGVDLIATQPQDVHLAGTLLQSFATRRFEQRLLALASRSARSASRGRRRFIVGQLINQKLLVLSAPIAQSIGFSAIGAIRVQVGARIIPAVLAATSRSSEVGPLAKSPVAVAPLAFAQQLTGMQGKITRILVQVKPGKNSEVSNGLRSLAAGRLNVEPGDFDATVFSQAATPVNQSTETFAAICALVGFMFAYCSMLLTAHMRQSLVRELRLAGATRRETLKALLFDAFALGAGGCLAGLVLGDALSIVAFSSSPGFLSFAFPVASQRIVAWQSGALAVAAGMLAACIGVLAPMRGMSAGTKRAETARRRPSVRWLTVGMLGGGLACLAGATVVVLLAPGSAIVGIATLIFALLLLLPLLIAGILKAFERLQRRFGARATAIAVLELRAPSARIRSIAIASTAAIAVFGSVTIQGSRANLQTGLERSFHGITSVADLWVVPSGTQSLVGTVPFHGISTSRLAALPGVRAVGIYRSSFLEVGDRRVWVLAPAPTAAYPLPPSQLVKGSIATATARMHGSGWAVISQTLAEEHHLHIGQRFTLPSPSSTAFRVAALSTNLGWPPGAVILSASDYIRAWGNSNPTAYTLNVWPGASLTRVGHEIRELLASEGATGLAVQTANARQRAQDAAARQGLTRLTQMALLALIAGILATAASTGAVTSQRRRQFARMKAQGFRRNMLWLALAWESVLLIGAGCLIGALFGIFGQLLLSHALISVTGFPVVVSPRVLAAIESFAAVTVIAAAVIAIPGYRVASVRPYPHP
jgi:putative ABC transport system permease protein